MAKRAKETAETAESSTSTALTTLPITGAVKLAGASAAIVDPATLNEKDFKGFKQLSLPPIVKPREMPTGAFLHGEITGIMDSPIKEYKNRILQLTRPTDGFRFCFPMTAVISKALGATDEEQDERIGDVILIKKTGTQKSKKGKKDMNLFEVYLKPKAEVRA